MSERDDQAGSILKYSDKMHDAIEKLLLEKQGTSKAEVRVKAMSSDGSIRRFWRVESGAGHRYVAVAPAKDAGEKECAEAVSSWKIGSHLQQVGVSVPEICGFDPRHYLLVYEDLGDVHLQSLITRLDLNNDQDAVIAREYYRKTIDQLLTLQCDGVRGFCQDWCWDTPRYDRELMLERESGYFLRAFWQGLLKQEVPDGLIDEFGMLAEHVSGIPIDYLLHRDFQSRNVMITNGDARIIDYQGGRFGPLGYDLASLLIDPYVDLPNWFQRELFDYYHLQLSGMSGISKDEFYRQYLLLAIQRNLQIIGAFAFLSNVRGKLFFKDYIEPAVRSLTILVAEQMDVSDTPVCTVLAGVLKKARDILSEQ